MAQIRKVEGFGKRYLLANLAYVIPGALSFWLMWRERFSRSFGVWFWVGGVGFVCCVVIGVVLEMLRLHRFRCPECHARLPWQRPKPKESQKFFCAKCDTVWDTGLTQGDD
jgi:hypothetical protein